MYSDESFRKYWNTVDLYYKYEKKVDIHLDIKINWMNLICFRKYLMMFRRDYIY